MKPEGVCSRASYRDAGAIVAILGAHAVVLWLVLETGFTAISDDDFSRCVISQTFAQSPRVDPSRTSWLPFPFWLTGVTMMVLGDGWNVARGVAWAAGLCSGAMHYTAARWAGLSRLGALIASLLWACVPSRAWAAAAAVPEGFTADLCLLGVASLATTRFRWVAPFALLAATWSRYEAWAIAAALAASCTLTAVRKSSVREAAWALSLLLGPLLWLLHGELAHGDPLFFVKRVASYRAAFEQSPALLEALYRFPSLLVRREPELCVLATAGGALILSRPWPRAFHSMLVACGALVTFLVVGDFQDGAPTHHPERALLPAWSCLTLIAGHAIAQLASGALASPTRPRKRYATLAALSVSVASSIWSQASGADPRSFVQRNSELAIGSAARAFVGAERVAILHDDYGYFAIMAGLAHAGQAFPLQAHDPRTPEQRDWTAAKVRAVLGETATRWLIAPESSARELYPQSEARAQAGTFVLLSLPEAGSGVVRPH